MIETDGSKYVGQWKNSMKNGRGQLTSAAGAIKSGNWVNDKFIS